MKRRTFLQISVPAVAGLSLPACKRAVGSVEPEALPLVLSGGNVFLQNKWQTTSVGIDSRGRLRFGNDLKGIETFNVSGKVVSPGFVDILADNSMDPDSTFDTFEKYKITDGVTTFTDARWQC